MSRVYHGEVGYLLLLSEIYHYGVDVPDRTGVGSRALFDAKLVWEEGEFPFFTHRPVYQRPAFEELWFMLRGKTQTKELEEKGVNFWKGNTSREFLDARGLTELPEGDMGVAYGYQWRRSGGLRSEDSRTLFTRGYDQLAQLYWGLKNDKYGRRHLVSLWNPSQLSEMALTPCWWACQFVVLPDGEQDVLHLKLINRSLDTPFGAVYAVQQYRMLQMALCKLFGFKLGKLSCDMTQVHIYQNQMEWVKEVNSRTFIREHSNTIELTKDLENLHDLLSLEFSDWNISYTDFNKEPFVTQKPEMAV